MTPVTFASRIASITFGETTEAKMPMIANTPIISIRVNADEDMYFNFFMFLAYGLIDSNSTTFLDKLRAA